MQFGAAGYQSKRRWLSLTSLIDVVFLLLIFFMLTTNFSQQRKFSLDIPAEKGEGKSAWHDATLVRIHEDGIVDFNGRHVIASNISSKVTQLLQDRPTIRFIVRPDSNIPLQQVVQVMDQLRAGGASLVSLIR